MDTKKSIAAKVDKVLPYALEFSKDQVLQLLQENEYDVKRTIADFVEERAAKVLNSQWEDASMKSSKSKAKKKNKPGKNKDKSAENKSDNKPLANGVDTASEISQKASRKRPNKPQDIVDNVVTDPHKASVALKHMLTKPKPDETLVNAIPPQSVSSPADAEPIPTVKKEPQAKESEKNPVNRVVSRPRTTSDSGAKTKGNQRNRKAQRNAQPDLQAGDADQMRMNAMHNRKSIEKAVRDLQRCSASYGRYRTLLNEEFEESYKRLKAVFEEINSALMDKEVELMRILDKSKESAFALLSNRETAAGALKKRTDRVDAMSPQQLNSLRNDVKHFVSERKLEEDLGKSVRFICDKDAMMNLVTSFGNLAPVKNLSVGHHRERYESTTSETSSIPPLAEHHTEHHYQPSPLAETEPRHDPPVSTQRSTSWADSVDSHPLQENRASWAVDTPLVTSGQGQPDGDRKKQLDKAKKERRKRFKVEKKENPSNTKNSPDDGKPFVSSEAKELPEGSSSPKSPKKASNFNKFERNRNERGVSQSENREGEFEKGDGADHRNRNYSRGRGGYRGGYRNSQGREYFQRGGYQNRNYRPRNPAYQKSDEKSDSVPSAQNSSGNQHPPRNYQRREGPNPQRYSNPPSGNFDHRNASSRNFDRKFETPSRDSNEKKAVSNPPSNKENVSNPSRNLDKVDFNPDHANANESKPLPPRSQQRNRRFKKQEGNPRSRDETDNPPPLASDNMNEQRVN